MKPTEKTPASATPAPTENPKPGLPETARSSLDAVAINTIEEPEAETLVEMADGRMLREIADQMVPAVIAEMHNKECPRRFGQSWYLLADGTLRKVPWIHNSALPIEKIKECIEQIKKDNDPPWDRYDYDLPTLLKFQRVVVSTAALVSVMLGPSPTATDVEMIREALTEVRDRLPLLVIAMAVRIIAMDFSTFRFGSQLPVAHALGPRKRPVGPGMPLPASAFIPPPDLGASLSGHQTRRQYCEIKK